MRLLKIAGLLILLAFAIAFPLLFPNPAITTVAVFTLMFAAAATAWNIFSGYTGYIALGHAVFFGTGAYTLAIMCQDWHIPAGYAPFYLLPLVGLVAAIIAIPLGIIALRTRRHTFIVITIAFFFIFQLMAYNLRGLTNGSAGIELPIPTWSGDFYNDPFYYVTLAVLLLALVVSWWVRNSKYGLGLLAIRDDEDRALGLGVKTGPSKLTAFVISAFFVGILGGVYAYFIEVGIYPAVVFDPLYDIAIALMSFMGGIGTLSGPIIGALILEPTQQYFTLAYGENGWYLVVYGAMFLVIILLLPRGIVPTISERWARWQASRRNTPEEVVVAVASGSAVAASQETQPMVERNEGAKEVNL
ncbi:MAG TPA: branched-chain amino acid ABC transporter permease [Ktedonobacteraceae bacterium]|nr:branched-chain amino acid ABC transporter permease [Ktedonobacteraceae bacterium]